jgi:hypothetical protein
VTHFDYPTGAKERILQTTTVTNEHLLTDAIAAKTGVIVAVPHAGNWDHAGAYFCAKGIRLVTVAERFETRKIVPEISCIPASHGHGSFTTRWSGTWYFGRATQ